MIGIDEDDPTGNDTDTCEACGEERQMHAWRVMPGTVFIDGVGLTDCVKWVAELRTTP